ncbi:hypothetical protein D3C72_1263590 [compost metagenome]
MRLTGMQHAAQPGRLIFLHFHVPGRDALDGGLFVGGETGDCLAFQQKKIGKVDARQWFGVIRLGQVLNVVQSPAEKAIPPIPMTAGKRQSRQAHVLIRAPVRPAAFEETGSRIHHRAFVEEAHMKRRLRAVLETRIAERLRAEAVERADVARVVAEQIDVVAVIRLISSAGEHGQRGNFFVIGNDDETLTIPR